MARVALGGSLGNAVEVCKGAAWYAQSQRHFFNILTEIHLARPKRSIRLYLLPSSSRTL